jgi:hypothetical protein
MRLPPELRLKIYELVFETAVLGVPQPPSHDIGGMIRRQAYLMRQRFFLQKPGLLAVCRLIYYEARAHHTSYTTIEMSPVSSRLRFQRILRAMRARTSRFHQVRKLVISGDMLRKALEVAEYNLLNGKDHVGTTRDDFPNLKVIVWPNGEDETKSKDECEAAMRYCFDKSDLQLVDVEYDTYYKNGAIFEHGVDRDFDDDDNNNHDDDINNDDEQA